MKKFTVYEVEVQNENEEMVEMLRVEGDRSLNALKRLLRPFGYEVEETSATHG